MKFLLILGAVLLVLFLISLIRVGGELEYGETRLKIWLRIAGLRFAVWPMRPQKPKKHKKKVKPTQKAIEKPTKSENTWETLKGLLPVITEAAGRFKRKIRIDRLDMDLTVAAGDPATAAVVFGGANAAIGMMIPIMDNNFNIKERNIRTRVDFDAASPTVWLQTAFSMTIGQGIALGFYLLMQFMKATSNEKCTQKEAV